MAVALIQFWLSMPIALYGTMAILLLAFVARYMPLGVRFGEQRAAADRPFTGGERSHSRCLLGNDHAGDHVAADPPGVVRRLAAGVRAGHPGAERVEFAVLL